MGHSIENCANNAVYMAVTCDRYELPIAISDSLRGIAREMGVDPACVHRHVHEKVEGKYKMRCKFVKVYVEDSEGKEEENE